MLAQENVFSRCPHLHFRGCGPLFKQLDAMMDLASLHLIFAEAVLQVLMAMDPRLNNAGGSSASVQFLNLYSVRLEKLVPEDWKEWQVPIRRGHAHLFPSTVRRWRSRNAWSSTRCVLGLGGSGKSGAVGVDDANRIRHVQCAELVSKARPTDRLPRVEEALRHAEPEDAGKPQAACRDVI